MRSILNQDSLFVVLEVVLLQGEEEGLSIVCEENERGLVSGIVHSGNTVERDYE